MTKEENSIDTNEPIVENSIGNILGGDDGDDSEDNSPEHPLIEDSVEEKEEVSAEAKSEDHKEEKVTEHNVEDLLEKITKLEKQEKDTKNWGHGLSRKLAGYKAEAKKLLEDGALTDTEAEPLLRESTHDIPQGEAAPAHPWQYYMDTWDKEVPNVRHYSGNPAEVDQEVTAFQHLLNNSSQEEITKTFQYLEEYKHDPVLVTKKMLEIGADYNKNFYKEYSEAGGGVGLRNSYKNKLAEKQKVIDKLEKDIVKLRQNSDYIPSSGYSIPAGSSKASHEVSDNSIGNTLNKAKAGKIFAS